MNYTVDDLIAWRTSVRNDVTKSDCKEFVAFATSTFQIYTLGDDSFDLTLLDGEIDYEKAKAEWDRCWKKVNENKAID